MLTHTQDEKLPLWWNLLSLIPLHCIINSANTRAKLHSIPLMLIEWRTFVFNLGSKQVTSWHFYLVALSFKKSLQVTVLSKQVQKQGDKWDTVKAWQEIAGMVETARVPSWMELRKRKELINRSNCGNWRQWEEVSYMLRSMTLLFRHTLHD